MQVNQATGFFTKLSSLEQALTGTVRTGDWSSTHPSNPARIAGVQVRQHLLMLVLLFLLVLLMVLVLLLVPVLVLLLLLPAAQRTHSPACATNRSRPIGALVHRPLSSRGVCRLPQELAVSPEVQGHCEMCRVSNARRISRVFGGS